MAKRWQWNPGMLAVIWALAWPTMLEQLMQTAVQYIDTAMVGVLGTSATAAVGATGTVNWLVNSSISALSIGFLSYIARARGAGDERAVKRAVAQVVLTALLVGTVFTALTVGLSSLVPVWMQVDPALQSLAGKYFLIIYLPMLPRTASIMFGTVLRAVGDTKTPMKIGVAMNITNVVLNFLLIYESRTVTPLARKSLSPVRVWGSSARRQPVPSPSLWAASSLRWCCCGTRSRPL